MYKGASQASQHALGVDRPHPSRGFTEGGPDPSDVLPEVGTMTREQLLAEKGQLTLELGHIQTGLTVAKIERRARLIAFLGQQHQTIQSRLMAVNLRLSETRGADHVASDTLGEAVREICDEDLQTRIFKRARELYRNAKGRPSPQTDRGGDG